MDTASITYWQQANCSRSSCCCCCCCRLVLHIYLLFCGLLACEIMQSGMLVLSFQSKALLLPFQHRRCKSHITLIPQETKMWVFTVTKTETLIFIDLYINIRYIYIYICVCVCVCVFTCYSFIYVCIYYYSFISNSSKHFPPMYFQCIC